MERAEEELCVWKRRDREREIGEEVHERERVREKFSHTHRHTNAFQFTHTHRRSRRNSSAAHTHQRLAFPPPPTADAVGRFRWCLSRSVNHFRRCEADRASTYCEEERRRERGESAERESERAGRGECGEGMGLNVLERESVTWRERGERRAGELLRVTKNY